MLNDKTAGVLTLVELGIEWIQNQTFLCLKHYLPLYTRYQVWNYIYLIWNHNLFNLYNRTACVEQTLDKSFNHSLATHQVLARELTLYICSRRPARQLRDLSLFKQ